MENGSALERDFFNVHKNTITKDVGGKVLEWTMAVVEDEGECVLMGVKQMREAGGAGAGVGIDGAPHHGGVRSNLFFALWGSADAFMASIKLLSAFSKRFSSWRVFFRYYYYVANIFT